MTTNNEHERIKRSINEPDSIKFHIDVPDKDYPEIKWSIYGLPKTNEIAVMVKAKNLVFYIAAQSNLYSPHMSNRIFGLEVVDQDLADDLSNKLWDSKKTDLLATL